MLDPEDAGRRLQRFFGEATDEEYLQTLRRATTDAEWEELTRDHPRTGRHGFAASLKLGLRKVILALRPKPIGPARLK